LHVSKIGKAYAYHQYFFTIFTGAFAKFLQSIINKFQFKIA